jgi:hypothetical protein
MGTQTCQVPNKEEIFLRGDEHRKKKRGANRRKKQPEQNCQSTEAGVFKPKWFLSVGWILGAGGGLETWDELAGGRQFANRQGSKTGTG